MRDTLPEKPLKDECGVMNLDSSRGSGSHWKCWVKLGNVKIAFDGYGLSPPTELVKYLGKDVLCNTTQVQCNGTYVCDHSVLVILAMANNSTESTLLRNKQLAINKSFWAWHDFL